MLTPKYNTTLLPHHQPIRSMHAGWSLALRATPASCLWKPFPQSHPGAQDFGAGVVPFSLHNTCNKRCPFLHHDPASVDWLYCMEGKQIQICSHKNTTSDWPMKRCESPLESKCLSQDQPAVPRRWVPKYDTLAGYLPHVIRTLPRAENVFSSAHSLSCVQLFATPWTAARQASLVHHQLLVLTQTDIAIKML